MAARAPLHARSMICTCRVWLSAEPANQSRTSLRSSTPYKASDGVSRPQAALASGYTFMQDLAELEAGQFEASGLLTDRLINNSWTAEDLRGLLSAHDGLTGSPYGILP